MLGAATALPGGMISQQIRYSARTLWKTPGFTAMALLTLAIGIGGSAAVFSIIRAVEFGGLPFAESDRIARISESVEGGGLGGLSFPTFTDFQTASHSFENIAVYAMYELTSGNSINSERVHAELATANYFAVLGVAPRAGRLFASSENSAAIVSHGFALRHSLTVGSVIRLNNVQYAVTGIMPRGFGGFGGKAEVWTPLDQLDVLFPQMAQFHFLQTRGIHFLRCIGRLRDGASLAQAEAELKPVAARIAREYQRDNGSRGVSVQGAREVLAGDTRQPLAILGAAVGLVFLMVCVNLTGLLLVRAEGRTREFAIRSALGASRSSLVGQLLTESLLVTFSGGALGFACAFWLLAALLDHLPVALPPVFDFRLGWPSALLGLALSMTAASLFGLVPAFRLRHLSISGLMALGGRGSSSDGSRLRSILVGAEVAISLTLVLGAGLLIATLNNLMHQDLGYRPDHLLTFRLQMPPTYQGARRFQVPQMVAERLGQVPGVADASGSMADPYLWNGLNRGFDIAGHPTTPAMRSDTWYQEVTPGYFKTMGIPLVSGRDFDARDTTSSPLSLMVTESFARRFYGAENPVGRRIVVGNRTGTVVGIAGDARLTDVRAVRGQEPVFYAPFAQSEVVDVFNEVVRTTGPPERVMNAILQAVAAFDPQMAVFGMVTLEDRVASETRTTQSYATLLIAFGAFALLLAGIGVYGTAAYAVGQRTREIGIRVALGAEARQVIGPILRDGIVATVCGLVAGLMISLLASRTLTKLLFGVKPTDPATVIAASCILILASVAACWAPARRALRVDPVVALRQD